MAQNKQYDHEYKIQAVKLAQEIGSAKAANELGIPKDTMYGWMKAVREGRLDIGKRAHTPQNALTLNEEIIQLRKQVKAQEKEIKRLKEENEYLEEASAFFAASRRRSPKKLRLKYLAMIDITKKWRGKRKDWGQIHSQLEVFFADRLTQ